MENIMIIGAGQLGSRHLQGAIQSTLRLNFIVVDPSIESLKVAKSRADEVELGNISSNVSFVQYIEQGLTVDLCIIATTANIRFAVFKDLIAKCNVKNIIFEKVLFQKESEYFETEHLLSANGINAWVNCPRRIYPAYQKIKKLLKGEKKIKLDASGTNWGLACNSIHLIDLFAFLSNETDYVLDTSMLKEEFILSKRAGFYEVYGAIKGTCDSGSQFSLNCSDDKEVKLEVKITTESFKIVIDETGGQLSLSHIGLIEVEPYVPLYQSQLSQVNLEEIIKSGKSSLTSYTESKGLHLPFIRSIQAHAQRFLAESYADCPIT